MVMTDAMQDREDEISHQTVFAIVYGGMLVCAAGCLGMVVALIVLAGR